LTARWSRQGSIWQARDQIAQTLAQADPVRQELYAEVLPQIDQLLRELLPELTARGDAIAHYLQRVDVVQLRQEVRRHETSLRTATPEDVLAIRRKNLALARANLQNVYRLQAAWQRYQAQYDQIVLALQSIDTRIASASLEQKPTVLAEVRELVHDVERLEAEFEHLELAEQGVE